MQFLTSEYSSTVFQNVSSILSSQAFYQDGVVKANIAKSIALSYPFKTLNRTAIYLFFGRGRCTNYLPFNHDNVIKPRLNGNNRIEIFNLSKLKRVINVRIYHFSMTRAHYLGRLLWAAFLNDDKNSTRQKFINCHINMIDVIIFR